MRITAAQRIQNENRIRAAMDRLLRGEIPPGGNCDIKTLARRGRGRPHRLLRHPALRTPTRRIRAPAPAAAAGRQKPRTRESLRSNASKQRLTSSEPILPRRIRQSRISPTSEPRPWPGSPPNTTRSFDSAQPTTRSERHPPPGSEPTESNRAMLTPRRVVTSVIVCRFGLCRRQRDYHHRRRRGTSGYSRPARDGAKTWLQR